MSIQNKLQKLGIVLPPPPKPAALYSSAKVYNDQIWISGQLPFTSTSNSATASQSLFMQGKLNCTEPDKPHIQNSEELQKRIDRGQEAMKICFLNGLSAAANLVDLEKITGIMKLGAYVSCSPHFTQQHIVANGASELALALFGEEKGKGVRFAVGVAALPLDASVELEIIFSCIK